VRLIVPVVILVGHSGGGLIVPQIAIKAPERIRRQFFLFDYRTGTPDDLLSSWPAWHRAHAYGVAREAKLATTVGGA
jgi:hypothetical protein